MRWVPCCLLRGNLPALKKEDGLVSQIIKNANGSDLLGYGLVENKKQSYPRLLWLLFILLFKTCFNYLTYMCLTLCRLQVLPPFAGVWLPLDTTQVLRVPPILSLIVVISFFGVIFWNFWWIHPPIEQRVYAYGMAHAWPATSLFSFIIITKRNAEFESYKRYLKPLWPYFGQPTLRCRFILFKTYV